MKIAHISDLHLGKRVNDFSMIEDQKYILSQTIEIFKENNIDALLICGDVYDKTVPSIDAVMLFNDYLMKLSELDIDIFIISGNHDSAERLSFGSSFFDKNRIHIAGVFNGKIKNVTLKDEYGNVNIYMLPFIRPSQVRNLIDTDTDSDIKDYTDAVKYLIDELNINKNDRNIIMAHQFVTGASTCESENISVGGLDNVDATVFEDFDYTALGHIHGKQSFKKGNVRYCGTLLKYSFSEEKHVKSVTIIELSYKKSKDTDSNEFLKIVEVPVKPLKDLRTITGTYENLTLRENYINDNTNDYIRVILKDEEDVWEAVSKLRSIYPNIMKLEYDNTRTKNNQVIQSTENIENKTIPELFSELYNLQNNKDMTEEQKEYVDAIIKSNWSIWNGEV